MRTSLSKYCHKVNSALEAHAREELKVDLESGDLSDTSMAIEDARESFADQMSDLVHASTEARVLDSDATELRDVELKLSNFRQGVEVVNQANGFTLESYQWAQRAVEAILSPTGLSSPLPQLSAESFESDPSQVLSLEAVDDVVATISTARSEVEVDSVDAILRVLGVLKEVMPSIKDRMIALKQNVQNLNYDEEAQIKLTDLVFKSLAVNGNLPTGWKTYFKGYQEFASCILSSYSENAQEAASKAPMVAEKLNSVGPNNCPITALCEVIKEIGDPRCSIDSDELCHPLPGSGPLFGQGVDVTATDAQAEVEADSEADDKSEDDTASTETFGDMEASSSTPTEVLIARLQRFISSHPPLDPMTWNERADVEGETPSIRVLSKESICCVLDELIKSYEAVNIKSYGESRMQAWSQARGAFNNYKQVLIELTPQQVAALSTVTPVMAEYLDTLFALATWPPLHLLTNMALTANAFVLLAECSISGQSAPPEVEAEPEEDDVPADGEVEEEADGAAAASADTDEVVDDEGKETDEPTGDEEPVDDEEPVVSDDEQPTEKEEEPSETEVEEEETPLEEEEVDEEGSEEEKKKKKEEEE